MSSKGLFPSSYSDLFIYPHNPNFPIVSHLNLFCYSESQKYEYIVFNIAVLHIEDQIPRKNEFNINILIAFIFQGY